jgi:hypothetical protein
VSGGLLIPGLSADNHLETKKSCPHRSFVASQIAPHAVFHYRFKVQGSGAVTMSFTGATGQARNAIGLELAEGEQGSLGISIEPGDRVRWATDLSVKR